MRQQSNAECSSISRYDVAQFSSEGLYTSEGLNRLQQHLQQVTEVKILLVRHVLQTVLTVDLGTSLVELAFHRVVDEVSW